MEIWNEALIELPAEGNVVGKNSLKLLLKEQAALMHGQKHLGRETNSLHCSVTRTWVH